MQTAKAYLDLLPIDSSNPFQHPPERTTALFDEQVTSQRWSLIFQKYRNSNVPLPSCGIFSILLQTPHPLGSFCLPSDLLSLVLRDLAHPSLYHDIIHNAIMPATQEKCMFQLPLLDF